MKKVLILSAFLLCVSVSFAQKHSEPEVKKVANDSLSLYQSPHQVLDSLESGAFCDGVTPIENKKGYLKKAILRFGNYEVTLNQSEYFIREEKVKARYATSAVSSQPRLKTN